MTMRAFLAIVVALAITGGLSRLAAAGVSKSYALSVAMKDGRCIADQDAEADGVSFFSAPGVLKEATAKVLTQTKESAYGCRAAEIPVEKKDYVGDWTAPGRVLSIAPSGMVHYQAHEVRNEGGSDVTHTDTFDLPLQKFEDDSFLIGAMYWSMSFRVTQPPRLEGGTWRMTLDGVAYSHS
jgi:hypothetical protein